MFTREISFIVFNGFLFGSWISPLNGSIRPSTRFSYKVPKETWMTTAQLIRHWGYSVEEHSVTTEDGFILELQRIRPPNHAMRANATPLLILHGFGASSEYWVYKRNNLPMALVDQGIEVWLGNFRGSYYGKKHKHLKEKDPKYWDFSWHEIGAYDIPALADRVLSRAGRGSLLLLCHSMGCTATSVWLALRPQDNARVTAAFMLAPPVYVQHTRGLFQEWKGLFRIVYSISKPMLGMLSVFAEPTPQHCFPKRFGKMLTVCFELIESIFGPFYTRNHTALELILSHYPNGASVRQAVHYYQLLFQGRFAQLDLGMEENLMRYGKSSPPSYNLTNIVAPVNMYYGDGDYLANYEDVIKLASRLPGYNRIYAIPAEGFNHIDFLLTDEIKLYSELISHIVHYK